MYYNNFKKIIPGFLMLAVVLSAGICHAQNDTVATASAEANYVSNPFKVRVNIRAAYVFPTGTGDNVLAKANEGRYGLSFKINLIEVYNFNIGAGLDYYQYNVTDPSRAGNIRNTNYNVFYGEIMYRMHVVPKLTVYPKISFGDAVLSQKTGSKKYGEQHGFSLGLGTNIDYEIVKNLSVFAGLNYNHTSINVRTNAEYEDFYRKLNQIAILLGLKIDIVNFPK